MRKVIAWNVMSLDGYFEGDAPWQLDFHALVWGEEMEAFSLEQGDDMDILVFGRRTYEGMAAHWRTETGAVADFMNAVDKRIASRSLQSVDWNNSALIEGDVSKAIGALKQQKGKNIYVFGSADLLETLLADNLVDEYRICLAPIVRGSGTPLFKPGSKTGAMDLLEARALKTGGVLLRYGLKP
ncbi:dihydrofolate reductase family protein [Pelagibacterium lentulum]|uniref:Riboflavin biosynthesis protein RibD n=1 Tax=Pelagibacterium lentulum TaxID=2029865 RepID=A0A916RHG0_9HYPH|nr:dihydrofolate reductase family protein [Pelagibacterium lentulum]GGA54445.1 riboflavin biosynthesis protein RibD [Pelagibacterium lentulum]